MGYNKQLVFDYISGIDFEEETLEKLENDQEFMTEVIRLTRDSKLYHYCSDSLKNNYSFIRFLIEQFKDNPNFVRRVSEAYLNGTNTEEIPSMELKIKLADLYDYTKDEAFMEYKLEANTIFCGKILEIGTFLAQEENQDITEDCGSGFVFVDLDYSGSKEIMDFFAKGFLNEFVFPQEIGLETIAHSYFRTGAELEQFGETNFLLNYISQIDSYLGKYLEMNRELLEPYKKEVARIKNNWDTYMDTLNRNRVEVVYDEMCHYEEEHGILNFDCREHLVRIIKKLGLEETFRKYPIVFAYEDDWNLAEEDLLFRDNEERLKHMPSKMTLEELAYVRHMTKFLTNLFENDYIDDDVDNHYLESEEKDISKDRPKTKVIRYAFKAKKVISATEE